MSARDRAEALLRAEIDTALAQVLLQLGNRLEIVEISVVLRQVPSSLSDTPDQPDPVERRPLSLHMRKSDARPDQG